MKEFLLLGGCLLLVFSLVIIYCEPAQAQSAQTYKTQDYWDMVLRGLEHAREQRFLYETQNQIELEKAREAWEQKHCCWGDN